MHYSRSSLVQGCVIQPAHCLLPYIRSNLDTCEAKLCLQVRELFPSARGLEMTWHSIVKIQQSLYREVRCC